MSDARQQLELRKLAAEVHQAERPWYKRLDTFVSLGTTLAGVAIAVATVTTQTALHELRMAELVRERTAAEEGLQSARREVDAAAVSRDQALRERDEARESKESLAAESSYLEAFLSTVQGQLEAGSGGQCQDLQLAIESATRKAGVLTENAKATVSAPASALATEVADKASAALAAGRAAFASGDRERARVQFQSAAATLRNGPAPAQLAYRLGLALENVFDWGAAKDMFKLSLAADPANPSARFALANLLLLTGEFEEVQRYQGSASPLAEQARKLQALNVQCSAGDAAACTRIGVGLYYSEGAVEGVNASEAFLKRGCPTDAQACHYLKLLAKARPPRSSGALPPVVGPL